MPISTLTGKRRNGARRARSLDDVEKVLSQDDVNEILRNGREQKKKKKEEPPPKKVAPEVVTPEESAPVTSSEVASEKIETAKAEAPPIVSENVSEEVVALESIKKDPPPAKAPVVERRAVTLVEWAKLGLCHCGEKSTRGPYCDECSRRFVLRKIAQQRAEQNQTI